MLDPTSRLAIAPAATVALLFVACAPPESPRPDVFTLECGSDVVHRVHDGSTLVFVLTTLTIDADDRVESPHTGFDLDGFASTESDPEGCGHPDFLSALDPESNCASASGTRCTAVAPRCNCRDALEFTSTSTNGSTCVGSVDNQLPAIANTLRAVTSDDIRASVRDDVASGRVVILARVTGIDAFDEDPEVHVQLLKGFTAPGTACTTPTPGARYQIDRASLRHGGTTEADSAVDLVGSIHQGRLRAQGGNTQAFTISFPFANLPFTFDLRHPIIAADITPDGATNGNFGGWVDGQLLADEFARIAPGYESAVRGVVGQLVDIELNGACGDYMAVPPVFGGVGFGLGFELVRGAIDPLNPVVDAPTPGTCGAPRD